MNQYVYYVPQIICDMKSDSGEKYFIGLLYSQAFHYYVILVMLEIEG